MTRLCLAVTFNQGSTLISGEETFHFSLLRFSVSVGCCRRYLRCHRRCPLWPVRDIARTPSLTLSSKSTPKTKATGSLCWRPCLSANIDGQQTMKRETSLPLRFRFARPDGRPPGGDFGRQLKRPTDSFGLPTSLMTESVTNGAERMKSKSSDAIFNSIELSKVVCSFDRYSPAAWQPFRLNARDRIRWLRQYRSHVGTAASCT